MRARARLAALFVPLVVAAGDARGQSRVRGSSVREASASSAVSTSFSARLGLAVADRLLASETSEDRIRGVERLAGIGRTEAIDRLVRALEAGSSVSRDPRARLVAVRALAPFATRDSVRQALAKVLAVEPAGVALLQLVRETAALALASNDDPRCIEVLAVALRQGGGIGAAARRALLAYPPRSAAALFGGKDPLAAPISELAGELGDLRALFALRATLAGGAVAPRMRAGPSPASLADDVAGARVAAALALARLGDEEQVAVARQWASSGDPDLALAAAEVLLMSGAEDGGALLARLVAGKETREPALRLALRAPVPALLPALEQAAKGARVEERRLSIALLGRLGDGAPAQMLGSMLADPERAWNAAFALANAAGDVPGKVLAEALGRATTRRLAARSGVARVLLRHDAPSGLTATLEALLQSKDAADRAAGAFGLAATGGGDVRSLILSRDPAVVRAAARASLLSGQDAIAAAEARLARETDPTTRAALGIVLAVVPEGSASVSTAELREWAEEGGPVAPLALVALGAREGSADTRRLDRFLASSDPVVRSHAAFALAESPGSDAASRLARAWQFETDPSVRRAVVASLARRSEAQRIPALQLASRFDPDATAREMARTALSRHAAGAGRAPGFPIAAWAEGAGYVAWIALARNAAPAPTEIGARAGMLVTSSGLALPVVTDPDGVLVAPGLGPGVSSFRLGSPPATEDVSAAGPRSE